MLQGLYQEPAVISFLGFVSAVLLQRLLSGSRLTHGALWGVLTVVVHL